jgi:hypothetical protein
MNKIPVGETVSNAYSFTFAGILSVIGVFWFPYLLYGLIIGGSIYLFSPDLPHQIVNGPYDVSLWLNLRRVSGIIFLFGIVTAAMVTVGLQQKAQGIRKGPVFFYFSLGSAVWRMIGAMFLGIVLTIVMAVVTAGICVAIWFGASNISQQQVMWIVRAVSIVVGYCWFVYFIVRLWFLLPAVVVAEDGIGLGRSWSLFGGNFWRTIGVWIAIFLPVAIGFGMVEQAIIGPFMPVFNFQTQSANDFHEIFTMLMKQVRVLGPVYIVLRVIQDIVFRALGNGASASAYRHLASGG